MRIYLDTNIYQQLKNDNQEQLRSLVLSDTKRNIYFFSEAHLYDLSRDQTDKKFDDMEFMEKICDNNCYHFDKHIVYGHFTPREYYEKFDWNHKVDFDSDLPNTLQDGLKSVNIRFGDIMPRQVSSDFPDDLFQLYNQSTNLYELVEAIQGFTEELSVDQKRFKELLKYLHAHSLTGEIYKGFGIMGFDGNTITDREAFQNSYLNICYKQSFQKDIYSVFTVMYTCLEVFGLVRGIIRKQKMMNMINDSRHAYFGSFCDVVVSSDQDFLNKTSFLYSALDLKILTFNLDEFEKFISDDNLRRNRFSDLVLAIDEMPHGNIRKITSKDNDEFFEQRLDHVYFDFFDTITFNREGRVDKYYFSHNRKTFSRKSLAREIEHVTNCMVNDLGPDKNGRTLFQDSEVTDETWSGRCWLTNGMLVELFFSEKLMLRISELNS